MATRINHPYGSNSNSFTSQAVLECFPNMPLSIWPVAAKGQLSHGNTEGGYSDSWDKLNILYSDRLSTPCSKTLKYEVNCTANTVNLIHMSVVVYFHVRAIYVLGYLMISLNLQSKPLDIITQTVHSNSSLQMKQHT